YLVCMGEPAPTVSEWRGFLQRELPEYMIPVTFVSLSHFPLTPNGKLDRQALPAPDQTRPELSIDYVAPRNALEKAIAKLWRELLQVEQVGIHDNFFDLGGHSLLLIRLIEKLKGIVNTQVPLIDLFRFPTVNSLARFLAAEDK